MHTLPLLRTFLVCVLLACGGCDAFTDPAADFMSDLDGTWSRTITSETIATDGTVTPGDEVRTDMYEVGRTVTCNTTEIRSEGDATRIAAAFRPEFPNSRPCTVLYVDADARRIILVGGTGDITTADEAGTIDEAGGNRQVWRFYTPISADGTTTRTLWTLTR